MENEELDIHSLLASVGIDAEEPEEETVQEETAEELQPQKKAKRSVWKIILGVFGKIFLLILETVLLLAVGLYQRKKRHFQIQDLNSRNKRM